MKLLIWLLTLGRNKGGPLFGATYQLQAIRLFWQNPGLLKFVVFPIMINLALGIIFYVSIVVPGWDWLSHKFELLGNTWDGWIAKLPSYLSFLKYFITMISWVVRIGLTIALFGLVGLLLAQFGTLLGSPWYGRLSEKIERLKRKQADIVEVGFVRDISRAVGFEFKKLLLIILIAVPCLILGFVPVVNTVVVPFGWTALGFLVVCLDFLDPPLERRRLKFRQKLGFIFRHLDTTLSFGSVCLTMMSIPFLNLLFVPICIASGTLLFCDCNDINLQTTHSKTQSKTQTQNQTQNTSKTEKKK